MTEGELRTIEKYLTLYAQMSTVEKMRYGDETLARAAELYTPTIIAEVRKLKGLLDKATDEQAAKHKQYTEDWRSLRSENDRLREALAPFALQVHHIDNAVDGQVRVWVSDVRRADAILNGKQNPPIGDKE